MFLIPTYVANSAIHGMGVFTPVPIPANTLIWQLDPSADWIMTPEELEGFPEPYRSRIKIHAYKNEDGQYVLCGDNSKYMNHSDEPNCRDNSIYTWARRDIAAGEELTCDYREFDKDSAESGKPVW